MLLSASEGLHWRYEVCEHSDGYLVQMRDLATGELDEEFSTIFRTLPVAFAYAEMSAAFERHAVAERAENESLDDMLIEVNFDREETARNFIDLSNRLSDAGINGVAIRAWEQVQQRSLARRLH